MERSYFSKKAQELTDLELAILLSLVAEQHCMIETDEEAIDHLGEELAAISSRIFNLSYSVIECSASTRLNDFREALFFNDTSDDTCHERKIANVIIAKNLHLARHEIQIQALELIRTKRISTHNTPKRFLFVALLPDGSPAHLTSHLVDHTFLSHYHSPEDGFRNLEEIDDELLYDDDGSASVIRKSISINTGLPSENPTFSAEEISELTSRSQAVTLGIDCDRYLHNIVVFLRLHRAVAGGISPRATKHFEQFARCLAPLHGLSYVTTPLVALAAKKVYPHRINITAPEDERSMQWGSDIDFVTEMLEDFTADTIIDDVLDSVEVPI
ncbi:MAG: hypothetical protein M1816_004833 [Peltula sp. TS41687]|nr:MAG: hypothetical protein M1816_004833 [Peltula sp. TS41687]